MSFSNWFDEVGKDGGRRSDRFYDILERLSENPEYTEHVTGWLLEAYEQGNVDAARKCHDLCVEQSKMLLRFSQFGSNAASDCAELIKKVYL